MHHAELIYFLLQVIAFVCGLIAIILLIIAIAANSWIEAQDYRQGLWKICTYDNLGDIETCLNPEASSRGKTISK